MSYYPTALPNDRDRYIGRVVCNHYIIDKRIGSGAFGVIYMGRDLTDQKQVAIKVEPRTVKHQQLRLEAEVYRILAGSPNIPTFYEFKQLPVDSVMVMELLGSSLEELFNLCNRRFSLKTVLLLADHMIQRIEYLHYKHFIHRDIKPDNFVVGLGEYANRIYLIDFGLAKRFRRPGSLVHIPFREKKNLTGTARYASINTHKGYEQSRRDDLESLGYVLVYFLKGKLPWQSLKAVNKNDKYGRIFEKKLTTSIKELCESLPEEFVTYFETVRSYKFEDRPDYDYLRRLFRSVMQRERYKRDYEYDWTGLTVPLPGQSDGSTSLPAAPLNATHMPPPGTAVHPQLGQMGVGGPPYGQPGPSAAYPPQPYGGGAMNLIPTMATGYPPIPPPGPGASSYPPPMYGAPGPGGIGGGPVGTADYGPRGSIPVPPLSGPEYYARDIPLSSPGMAAESTRAVLGTPHLSTVCQADSSATAAAEWSARALRSPNPPTSHPTTLSPASPRQPGTSATPPNDKNAPPRIVILKRP